MDVVNRYLILPRKYCDWLGGLRWSSADDAIVYADGQTFAFQEEVALFIEGFAGRRLIHLGQIVHFLALLRHYSRGDLALSPAFVSLRKAFEETGHPYRNAGTFAAALCGDLPGINESVSVDEICSYLRNPQAPVRWFVSLFNDTLSRAETPAIEPAAFEELMERRLSAYDFEEVRQWLRHGRGPVKQPAEMLVRQIELPSPRNLVEMMTGLLRRHRLSGAAPFVGQLVSALSLPPRRLEHQELPVGGYADVTTRGGYDQLGDLLPSQFVLDDLEFMRRFAEHELLHFRREEPQSSVKEELVVLLDQGVRTWGDVRLVLSAAAAAFTKLADRRHVRLQFAGTGSDGRLIDPLESNEESLGEFLEASDLTINPGLALESVLQQDCDSLRDIVVLSHPRNFREEDVVAASRRSGPKERLFGVSLDDQGRGQLSQIKHGVPVKVRDFRLDLSQLDRRPEQIDEQVAPSPATGWTGHAEPIPSPFRFGVKDKIAPELFDFDYGGEWLFTACANGMIYAWSVEGRQMQILPRGWRKEAPVTALQGLVGVAGGVVVLGCTNTSNELLAVHYDLLHRECQVYGLGATKQRTQHAAYFREYHTLLIHNGPSEKVAIDLGTGKLFPPPSESREPLYQVSRRTHSSSRAKIVYSMDPVAVQAHGVVRRLAVFREHHPSPYSGTRFLQHNAGDGSLLVNGMSPPWKAFIPRSDGMAIFRTCVIQEACCAGRTLALLTDSQARRLGLSLRLFEGPEGVALAEYPMINRRHGFVLSHDGRRLARQVDRYQVEVRDVKEGGPALLITETGGSHHQVEVYLGENWLAFVVGNHKHVVRWDRGSLEVYHGLDKLSSLIFRALGAPGGLQSYVEAKSSGLDKFWPNDSHRFVSATKVTVLAVVDRFGQVAILDLDQHLICMFFVYRNAVAAWMPSDIRWGPAHLTGGPATPSAGEKIAKALCAACRRGKGGQT